MATSRKTNYSGSQEAYLRGRSIIIAHPAKPLVLTVVSMMSRATTNCRFCARSLLQHRTSRMPIQRRLSRSRRKSGSKPS